jgi:hypothetical protein
LTGSLGVQIVEPPIFFITVAQSLRQADIRELRIVAAFTLQQCQPTWPLLPVGATLGLRLNYEFP